MSLENDGFNDSDVEDDGYDVDDEDDVFVRDPESMGVRPLLLRALPGPLTYSSSGVISSSFWKTKPMMLR